MKDRDPLERLKQVAAVVRRLSLKDHSYAGRYIELIPYLLQQTVDCLLWPIKERHKVGLNQWSESVYCVHYTSVEVIVQLLQGSANREQNYLRLYDSRHSNDPGEGHYFIRHAKRIIGLDDLFVSDCVQHAYYASFILDEDQNTSDNLLFWRMYGKDGKGCSLRFPLSVNRLFRVLYGAEEVKETAREFKAIYKNYKPKIIEVLDQVVQFDRTSDQAEKINQSIDEAFIEELELIKYLYKSDYFEYENEVRVIETLRSVNEYAGKVNFDLDRFGSKIRHYREHNSLATGKIFVTGCTITIGPSIRDTYNLKFCLRELLKEADLPGPVIKFSKVPYRKI